MCVIGVLKGKNAALDQKTCAVSGSLLLISFDTSYCFSLHTPLLLFLESCIILFLDSSFSLASLLE